jgi:hypothetical protein
VCSPFTADISLLASTDRVGIGTANAVSGRQELSPERNFGDHSTSEIGRRPRRLIRTWEVEGNADVPGLQEAANRLIADMKARGLAKETIAKYELLRDELVTVFGSVPVILITPDDAARFRERWEGRPSTIEKKLERLKSFFKFCLDATGSPKIRRAALSLPKRSRSRKSRLRKMSSKRSSGRFPFSQSKGSTAK